MHTRISLHQPSKLIVSHRPPSTSPAPTISSLLHSCPGLATYWRMCKCCVTYLLTYLLKRHLSSTNCVVDSHHAGHHIILPHQGTATCIREYIDTSSAWIVGDSCRAGRLPILHLPHTSSYIIGTYHFLAQSHPGQRLYIPEHHASVETIILSTEAWCKISMIISFRIILKLIIIDILQFRHPVCCFSCQISARSQARIPYSIFPSTCSACLSDLGEFSSCRSSSSWLPDFVWLPQPETAPPVNEIIPNTKKNELSDDFIHVHILWSNSTFWL